MSELEFERFKGALMELLEGFKATPEEAQRALTELIEDYEPQAEEE